MISFGLPAIDEALRGWPSGARPRCFALLAGVPDSGKSSFMQTLAIHLAEQGQRVLYVPLMQWHQSVLLTFHGTLPEKLIYWHQSLMSPRKISQAVAAEKDISVVLINGPLLPDEDVTRSLGATLDDLVTEQLREIAHQQDVFLLATTVVEQGTTAGRSFPAQQAGAGRDGIARCDLAFQIWRPSRDPKISESEAGRRRSQFVLRLAKNRYGAEALQPLLLDPDSGALHSADSFDDYFLEPTASPLVPFQLSRPSGLSERLTGPHARSGDGIFVP